jgi:hypothetical protein
VVEKDRKKKRKKEETEGGKRDSQAEVSTYS